MPQTVSNINKRRCSWTRALLVLLALTCCQTLLAAIPMAELTRVTTLTEGLSLPSDVVVGRHGHIYVVDSGNHRIAIFDRNGNRVNTFGGLGSGKNQLRDPVGIGVDHSGQIYVADKGNHRIQVFSAEGSHLRSIPLSVAGKDIAPIDVAVDASGKTLYVSGNNNHKVMSLNADGKLLSQWGGEGMMRGEFRYPATIAIGADHRVYVVDVLNTRVQVRDDHGQIFQVGEWGVLPGQLFRPKGVALDNKGRVYVSDSYLDVVQVFSSAYKFLHVLSIDGKARSFTTPAGMFIDSDNHLYVTEMLKNRVSVFELPP